MKVINSAPLNILCSIFEIYSGISLVDINLTAALSLIWL